MIVNIVCGDVGWIYAKFITMFRKYSKHQILLNKNNVPHNVTHYLPYYEKTKRPSHPCTIWASHQEAKKDLHNKFISAAQIADFTISHSKKYMDMLKNAHGVTNIEQVIPGVDTHKFKLRSVKRKKYDKLIVGYVGRQYSSSARKNPKLLDRISKMPNVELRVTGGKIKEENIPKFYADLDLVVSPATIEGGPMAIQESLAVGVPVVCFENVGVANEFKWGVYKIKFGDSNEFIRHIERFWDSEHYVDPHRDLDVMQKLRSQVEEQTWKKFVEAHDKIWSSLA